MSFFETFFLVVACALYVAAFFLVGKRWLKYGFFSLAAGLVFQFSSAATRWLGVGHPPIFGTYEATLSASWFLLLFAALSFRSAYSHFRFIALAAIPLALLLLIYSLFFFGAARMPLTISELSLWVDFHALFAWLAFAPFTLAFCLSARYLWLTRSGRFASQGSYPGADEFRKKTAEFESMQRQLEIIDEIAFRYVNFGFIMHTLMFALGSYYSAIVFGLWWRWDPVFSLSLVAWLLVGLYIHMRLFFNWQGRRAGWFFIAIFVVINLSYWGLVYLPSGSTFHVFDIDPKML